MGFKFTRFLLYLTIFCTPLYVIRFHLGPFPTTLLEILILLTFTFWLLESKPHIIRIILNLPTLTRRRGRFQNPDTTMLKHPPATLRTRQQRFAKLCGLVAKRAGVQHDKKIPKECLFENHTTVQLYSHLPILLFFLAGLISTITSPDKHGAFGALKAYIAEPILIYIIIRGTIKTQEDVRKLIASVIASGIFASLWVTAQAAFGWFITNPTEAMLGRAHGPYNTANAVGLYLGPIFALALGTLKKTRYQDNKLTIFPLYLPFTIYHLLIYSSSASLLIAIFLSRSTGALIATASVVLCFPLINKLARYQANKFSHLLFTIYYLLSLTFIFFLVPHLTPKTSWTRVRPENYTTTTIRLCLWEGTRNMLLDKPIFGAGLSGFKELYAQKYTTCDTEPLEYPHNLILNFWAEMGILGVISFLWLIWKALKNTTSLAHSRGVQGLTPPRCLPQDTLELGVTLALIYILIHGLVDVPYFKNDLSLQFWLLLALSSIRFS